MEIDKFSFPFHPYPQQNQLMEEIYECLQAGGVGCFESPTGTGKSLSTICAMMTWLIQREDQIIKSIHAMELEEKNSKVTLSSSNGEDWLAAYINSASTSDPGTTIVNKVDQDNKRLGLQRYNIILKRISEAAKRIGVNSSTSLRPARVFKEFEFHPTEGESFDNEEFNLPDYKSDEDNQIDRLSLDMDDEDGAKGSHWEDLELPQILFCSRTHTQLAQFVAEIKKTNFKNARCIILGSRKNLCINSSVLKLRSETSINEKCLDMQKSKASLPTKTGDEVKKKTKLAKEGKKCSYKNKEKEVHMSFKQLGSIQDVEETISIGHDLESCPYYASREAIQYAQIICMPYSMLLHSDVRESSGINIKGRVIIIDEAHNLIESINQLHSAEVTMSTIAKVIEAFKIYMSRFDSLLHGRNLYYINLISTVAKKLKSTLAARSPSDSASLQRVFAVNEFLFISELDHVNLFKLKKYITATNLINRIGGFVDFSKAKESSTSDDFVRVKIGASEDSEAHSYRSAIRLVLNFISCLTNQDGDGRVFVTKVPSSAAPSTSADTSLVKTQAQTKTQTEAQTEEASIKFHMLNPATNFKDIVDSARSLVLLGGTMQPFSYFTSSILRDVPPSRLRVFSCGHIVDRARVKPIVLTSASSQQLQLELTHDKRLGFKYTTAIFEACKAVFESVPHGVVVFFTSYQYLAAVMARWRTEGHLQALERLKSVYIESKSSNTEAMWEKYCRDATWKSGPGAALFSVIGGKLSEGINFSDELARAVVVVGMPFPDTRDPVLQEKINFAKLQDPEKGSFLPEVLCMKAVNQAIGRSIRHARDFASIVLIDSRYSQPRVTAQLPAWIQQSLQVHNDISLVSSQLREFFAVWSTA